MGFLFRLAVTAGVVLSVLQAADYTKDWPIDKDIRGWNAWINDLIIPQAIQARLGLSHELTMYLRNLIFGTLQYQLGSGLWSLYIYKIRSAHFFPDPSKVQTIAVSLAVGCPHSTLPIGCDFGRIAACYAFLMQFYSISHGLCCVSWHTQKPTSEMIWDHVKHGQASLFSYAALPLVSAFLSERKINQTYGSIASVGWPMYCVYTFIYFWIVEFGVYFVHRNLHTVKFLYNHVHLMHHKYNKPEEVRAE